MSALSLRMKQKNMIWEQMILPFQTDGTLLCCDKERGEKWHCDVFLLPSCGGHRYNFFCCCCWWTVVNAPLWFYHKTSIERTNTRHPLIYWNISFFESFKDNVTKTYQQAWGRNSLPSQKSPGCCPPSARCRSVTGKQRSVWTSVLQT